MSYFFYIKKLDQLKFNIVIKQTTLTLPYLYNMFCLFTTVHIQVKRLQK